MPGKSIFTVHFWIALIFILASLQWIHLQRFHVLEHINPRLTLHQCACTVVVVPVLSFMVRIRLHCFCVLSSTRKCCDATKLLPRLCNSPCSRMTFGQQPYDNTLWLNLLVDVHESIHSCLYGNTRPVLWCTCDVPVLYDVDLLLLRLTWKNTFNACASVKPLQYTKFSTSDGIAATRI